MLLRLAFDTDALRRQDGPGVIRIGGLSI